MHPNRALDVYTPREIARAAGVPEEHVLGALGGNDLLVPHADAVRIGRELATRAAGVCAGRTPALFSIFSSSSESAPSKGVPLVLSGTLHAGIVAAVIFITAFGLAPTATTLDQPEPMRLVFVATPGPGGGGGGGGRREPAPPPKALREGHHAMSSPLPLREPPKPIVPAPPPDLKPPTLDAEPLPILVAPLVALPADMRDRVGVLEHTLAQNDSHGSGAGGGAGSATGTGIGEGEGPGIGPGSGGGAGGGPFRPGSGIEPPRLLREVKPDYTEEARRRNLVGEVVLEIVVRRDGSVGDVTVLRGLGAGLNERAAEAVRQWRFSPAHRQGAPVDVIVEVAVEFRLR